MSAEQDPVAEEGEVSASIHLAFDQLGFGVDAFGSAVVVRVGQGVVHGVTVLVEAAGEGVYVGQVGVTRFGDPGGQALGVAVAGGQQGGEGAYESNEGGGLYGQRWIFEQEVTPDDRRDCLC
jgi:hypothetical protein